jgi:hypothetical protein
MAGRRKLSPLEAFESNITDAEWLLRTATILENKRSKRMRRELREKIGSALRINSIDRDQLDCIQNPELIAVFMPGASIGRSHVQDLTPLRRQAIVAAAAALETYVSDAVLQRVISALSHPDGPPDQLGQLTLTIADWVKIERYTRHKRALREVVLNKQIPMLASTAPSSIGSLVKMVGLKGWTTEIDRVRGTTRGTTERELQALTNRRNKIAHSGDRDGRGRATLTQAEAIAYVDTARSVAHALESLLGKSDDA